MATDPNTLHIPAGTATDGVDPVALDARTVWLGFCGLRVLELAPGEWRMIETGADELVVLPLEGGSTVEAEGHSMVLEGRDSVFARVSDAVYLPRDTEAALIADRRCQVALPSAPARVRRESPTSTRARWPSRSAVPAGPRGQVTNFLTPEVALADRLLCCEVLTPPGNWSSYPPHKHDESGGVEAVVGGDLLLPGRGPKRHGGPPHL